MVSPENVHTTAIIQTEQVIFGKISEYAFAHRHVAAINEKKKETLRLKESKEGEADVRVWREEREGEIIMQLFYDLKSKRNKN